MGQPLAFGARHVGKYRLEGGILRGTGIDAKANFSSSPPHMAHTHLGEMLAVSGTLDAIIILPADEPVLHGFDIRIDGGGSQVGVTVVGRHTAQMLKMLIFMLHGALQL